ncbi:MAG: hypothetical protein M3O31_02525 [Acidobacteriota bacterium]|nr:hypothetical protein [Acidobacteriota bacterium]
MVVSGYLDESEDDDWFTLGALFSTGAEWTWLEVDWTRCLERWNKKLITEGRPPITRFHASDCWQRNNEFDGWSREEGERFREELRGILADTGGMHAVSLSLRPCELAEVFEVKTPKRIKRGCYQVLLQYLMMEIGVTVSKANNPRVTVPLIHDRTKHYDKSIERSFFELKDSPGFRYSRYYTTIVPMSWEQCVALQPADMIAYECRKQVRNVAQGFPLGGDLLKIMDLPSFGGTGRYFRKDNLEHLKQVLDEVNHKLTEI